MQIGLLYLRPSWVTLRASCHMLGGHPQEPPGTPPLCHEQPPPPRCFSSTVSPPGPKRNAHPALRPWTHGGCMKR